MNDALEVILESLRDVKRDLRGMTERWDNGEVERARARDENTQRWSEQHNHNSNVLGTLKDLTEQVRETNGQVKDHKSRLVVVETEQQRRQWLQRMVARPVVWATGVTAAGLIGAGIKTLTG